MKTLLSILTFSLVFSFAQAQVRNPLSTIIEESRNSEIERPMIENRGVELIKRLQLSPEETREERHREYLRSYVEKKRSDFKESRQKLDIESKERITGLIRGVSEKLNNAIERLDNIEERLNNLVAENNNINIEESLSNASELKTLAQNSVDEILLKIEEELDNTNGTSKEILRELINIAQLDIKNSWNAFREVIMEVKLENN